MKKLVTHNNGFHADDVTAYAILKEVLTRRGETWTLARTRNQEIIDQGDIVFDIGEQYDPIHNRYDHHQKGRAGARANGIFYGSAGLVWNHFGRELCSTEAVWRAIDQRIMCELDAVDNGQNYFGEVLFKDAGYTSMAEHLGNFEADMFQEKTPELLQTMFEEASDFMRGALVRMIKAVEAGERAFAEATKVYEATKDKRIVVFEKNYERPIWRRLATYPEIIYVVYPNEHSQTWKVECVNKAVGNLESRKLFPEFWRGLRDEEFARVSGVDDAQFCHPGGFLLGTVSKKSALALAEKALLFN